MEKVLNQEEIDAMVLAARGGVDNSATRATVQQWDAKQAGQIGREQMKSINSLHEGFARNLTHALGAFLRVVLQVGLVSAEHLTYREFLQRMPEVTYMCSTMLTPMSVISLLQLDLAVAFPLIDVLLGGEGRGTISPREITEIEEQILESVVQIVLRELGVAWQALNLEFHFDRRQVPANAQRLMPPEEKTLSLSFEVTTPESRGTMNLVVPAIVSNALLRKLTADWTYQKPKGPAESQQLLRKRLLECPFEAELLVPNLRISVEELANLAPGKLLAFGRKIGTPSTLSVGTSALFSASVVRQGKQRSARLLASRTECSNPKELV
jgi:flagellar motor switch protein FliM